MQVLSGRASGLPSAPPCRNFIQTYVKYISATHYPRWIDAGKMSPGKAAHEIAVMEAIVADCRAAAEKERLL